MAVEVGDRAPDFELRDQHGTPVRLSGFRGAKNVVLVFYPLAFSGVCTSELCAMRDEFPEVTRDDVELLTVSVDSTFTHRAWSDAEHFQFELLSDFWPHGDVAKLYGVFHSGRGIAITDAMCPKPTFAGIAAFGAKRTYVQTTRSEKRQPPILLLIVTREAPVRLFPA